MPVDISLLPNPLLFDTTVLIPALRRKKKPDVLCAEIFDAMIGAKKLILVPAPGLAEFLRKETTPIPASQHVEVVPFDQACARILGQHFPPSTLIEARTKGGGAPLAYYKFDSLILAIAKRHGAPVLTLDGGMAPLAAKVSVRLIAPDSLQAAQSSLFEGPDDQTPAVVVVKKT